MCNAWNHPINCTCGWGGDGHLGQRSEGIIENGIILFDRNRIYSYTIPNAVCPVCGESVFFYKSEHGGQVFFDDLGPPWPKHHCTDNARYRDYIPEFSNYIVPKVVAWKESGWVPVVVNYLSNRSSYIFSVERIDTVSGPKLRVVIKNFVGIELTSSNLIIFANRRDDMTMILSIFDVSNHKTYEFKFEESAQRLDSFFNDQMQNT